MAAGLPRAEVAARRRLPMANSRDPAKLERVIGCETGWGRALWAKAGWPVVARASQQAHRRKLIHNEIIAAN